MPASGFSGAVSATRIVLWHGEPRDGDWPPILSEVEKYTKEGTKRGMLQCEGQVKAARPVLNGEEEETGRKVLRLVLTQLQCGISQATLLCFQSLRTVSRTVLREKREFTRD